MTPRRSLAGASAAVVLSCEHATARVPARFLSQLGANSAVLASHRAYDEGAYAFARTLAQAWQCPLVIGEVSRLLIDLNRSKGSRGLFSEFSRTLSSADKAFLLERYYLPYRQRVLAEVVQRLNTSPVVHLSVHSFVPVLHGKPRTADLGILFDPARKHEQRLATALKAHLQALAPDIKVRFNYPYRGIADGLTTGLRGWFPETSYVGLELEFNQAKKSLWRQRRFTTELAQCWSEALQICF